MSLASAIGQLLPHLWNQNPYIGAGNIPFTLTVGDMPREEMVSVLKPHCRMMGGYKDGVDFVQPFFDRLNTSSCKNEVKLVRIPADLGPRNSWPEYCGHEVNSFARNRGLEFCTPEIVCKLLQAWLKTPLVKRDHFYVSFGNIFCFFTGMGEKRRQVVVCNDYSDIPFGEDVVYVDVRKQER